MQYCIVQADGSVNIMAVRSMKRTGLVMVVMMMIQVCCEVEQIICRNPERGVPQGQ